MSEQQMSLELNATGNSIPEACPLLRDEIARAWGLPLGQRVEVCLRGGERSAAIGKLELLSVPEFPWNPRQPLQLRISGFHFSSRDIERWTIV